MIDLAERCPKTGIDVGHVLLLVHRDVSEVLRNGTVWVMPAQSWVRLIDRVLQLALAGFRARR